MIGHEISHHFDDQGSRYDRPARLREWWTPQDRERFKALTGQLVEQYDGYEPLPGQRINGELTLGENIADLAGLTVAYDAYQWRRWAASGAGARRVDRRPALLSRLGSDLAAQISRGEPAAATADRSALALGAARRCRAQPRSLVRGLSVAPDDTLYLAPERRVRIW